LEEENPVNTRLLQFLIFAGIALGAAIFGLLQRKRSDKVRTFALFYTAFLFFLGACLTFLGVIQWNHLKMDWLRYGRIFGGIFFLGFAWREYRKRPTSKVWILGVVAGTLFFVAAIFEL
jgi:hypothetical protein